MVLLAGHGLPRRAELRGGEGVSDPNSWLPDATLPFQFRSAVDTKESAVVRAVDTGFHGSPSWVGC